MTSSAETSNSFARPLRAPAPLARHVLIARYAPLATMVALIVAIWYIAAILMNWTLVRDGFERHLVSACGQQVSLAGRHDASHFSYVACLRRCGKIVS